MDTRIEIDERIMKDEGILQENESLKTDIKAIAKDNKKLEKQIKDMQKIQLKLLKEDTDCDSDNSLHPLEDHLALKVSLHPRVV